MCEPASGYVVLTRVIKGGDFRDGWLQTLTSKQVSYSNQDDTVA
jgi:hypothetical protein